MTGIGGCVWWKSRDDRLIKSGEDNILKIYREKEFKQVEDSLVLQKQKDERIKKAETYNLKDVLESIDFFKPHK